MLIFCRFAGVFDWQEVRNRRLRKHTDSELYSSKVAQDALLRAVGANGQWFFVLTVIAWKNYPERGSPNDAGVDVAINYFDGNMLTSLAVKPCSLSLESGRQVEVLVKDLYITFSWSRDGTKHTSRYIGWYRAIGRDYTRVDGIPVPILPIMLLPSNPRDRFVRDVMLGS